MDWLIEWAPGASAAALLLGSVALIMRNTVGAVLRGDLVPIKWVEMMMRDKTDANAELRAALAVSEQARELATDRLMASTVAVQTSVRALDALAEHAGARRAAEFPTQRLPVVVGRAEVQP